GHSTTAL
ncbi:putative co/Zn/Cd efflux system membrane component, partial [Vibrio parahaemolyticus V-223/04]